MTVSVLGAAFQWPLRLFLSRQASVWRALVALPLLPALGMSALTVELSRDQLDQVAVTQRVEREVVTVRTLVQLRTALGEEAEVAAVRVLEGDDYHSYLDRARPFLGTALGSVEQSRSVTDELVGRLGPVALHGGALAGLTTELSRLREPVDSSGGTPERRLRLIGSVIESYTRLMDEVYETESSQARELASGAQGLTSPQLLAQIRALESIVAVVAPGEMAVRSFYLPMVFPSLPLTELQARSRADALLYRVRSQDLSNQLPSGLARTSRALVDDPEIRRFSSLLEVGFQPDAKQLAKAGDQPDPTQNPEIFALAQSGARTLTVLGRLLDQAVQEAVATAQADRHRTSLRAAETVALAVVLLVVTVNTLVMIGGALSRRLRELAVGAQRLRAGHLANVSVKGPRELAAASGAINDAVLNLRAVQVKAEILASGDFSAPELEEPAPGPLGRAVHASVARIVSTAREREELRQRLAYEATHDALTGLVNRAEVHKALQSALDRARFTGLSVSVIFIDLDRFKACNDRFGHAAGDHVLRTVSASLLAQIREQDTAGRLGGDEFVLIIESLPIGAELLRLGNRLVQVLSEPVAYENQLIEIGASIGIASDTGGTTDADELIRQADLAAYRAKAVGGGTVEVHAPVLSSHAESR